VKTKQNKTKQNKKTQINEDPRKVFYAVADKQMTIKPTPLFQLCSTDQMCH
jgi:hypothetical protein